MSGILALAKKDLLLLWRDKLSMFWLLGLPLIYALFFGSLFGGSGSGDSGGMSIAVVDDLDANGEVFVQRLAASDAIAVERMASTAAQDAVRRGQKVAWLRVIEMPEDGFGMFSGQMPRLEVGVDPARRAEGGLLQGLLMEAAFGGIRDVFSDPDLGRAKARESIAALERDTEISAGQRLVLRTFFGALEVFLGQIEKPAPGEGGGFAEPEIRFVEVARVGDRPRNAFEVSFPQAILWGVMACAAAFAMTMVRERSDGTLLRLFAAPVTRGQVLAGKGLACFAACVLVIAALLAFGAVCFGVRITNPGALALGVGCTSACFVGLMLLFSVLGRTEQAASGAAWGVLLVMAMLGGGMVPLFVMPDWMKTLSNASPVKWAIHSLEGAIWRGFDLGEMLAPCAILIGTGVVSFAIGRALLGRTNG